MIVTRIEKVVEDTNTPVSMNLGGVKFSCVVYHHSTSVTSAWMYKTGEGTYFKNARELFIFMLQAKCPHKNTELNTWGGMSYESGDVSDTNEEELFCLDCGKTLEDK